MGMKVPTSTTIGHGDKTIDTCVSPLEYGLPIDEEELDRIDMSHAKYIMLLEKKLFLAPITPNPQRILDLGTGTGIWAIDMAEKYPSAEVCLSNALRLATRTTRA